VGVGAGAGLEVVLDEFKLKKLKIALNI